MNSDLIVYKSSDLNIGQFRIGRMRNFTYIIESEGEAFIVDPQDDLALPRAYLKNLNANLVGVLLTHTHWDHILGVPQLVKEFPNNGVYFHREELKRMDSSISASYKFLSDGSSLAFGNQKVKVLHTPGHSKGEICFFIEHVQGHGEVQVRSRHLFTGDTVFIGDVGRTDLDGGSSKELFETLQRLKTLDPDTVVYPGHDYGSRPISTLGEESKLSKAFLCDSWESLDALP